MAVTTKKLAPSKVNLLGLLGGDDAAGLAQAEATPDHIIFQVQVDDTSGLIDNVKVHMSSALSTSGRIADSSAAL